MNEKFAKIIPTAIVSMYPRTLSDIEFYPEIFAKMREKNPVDEKLLVAKLAPELEARHKIIDKYLRETGATQMLEIASGFSPRGLIFAKNNPEILYAEMDLPDLIETKKAIFCEITDLPENLRIFSGNALNENDFAKIAKIFDPKKPLAIVNEGLFWYLNRAEKAKLAKNVRSLLEKFGGVWLSGDGVANSRSLSKIDFTQKLRGDKTDRFLSQKEMAEFFAECGFSVKFHDLTEVQDELISPKKLKFSAEEIREKLLGYATLMEMRAKK